jgi:hypothetical protein
MKTFLMSVSISSPHGSGSCLRADSHIFQRFAAQSRFQPDRWICVENETFLSPLGDCVAIGRNAVITAQVGIQAFEIVEFCSRLDARLRGHDEL